MLLMVSLILCRAFAWFSDLLVEHADIFWSLFAVDMTAVLDQQPEDQWDTFPLFQLLNDYLRLDGMPILVAVIGSHSENLLARSRKSLQWTLSFAVT